MPSVKIGIDIRRMTEFGVGTYIRNVVRTLGRLGGSRNMKRALGSIGVVASVALRLAARRHAALSPDHDEAPHA